MKYIIIFLMVVFFMGNSVHAEVLFIANKSVNEKNMSSREIKDIFLGKKKKWSDNTKIHFVILDNEKLHNDFLKTYIKKTTKQYDAYWKNMLFTGKGSPPKEFETTRELIEYVTATEGAIGYIDSSSIAANVNTISVE